MTQASERTVRADASPSGVRPLSSVLKTLALLDLLGAVDRPMRLVELTKASGESRATVYQKLLTLVEAGWAEQTEDGAYRLSIHAARVGEMALEQASLGERSGTILKELVLQAGETVSLAGLTGVHAQIVKRVEAEVVVRAQVVIGTRLSLDQSASGRVLMAFASPETLALLDRQKAVLPPASVLREVAQQGYAVSTGKEIPGVRSVAVPVFDDRQRCVWALSIVAPEARFDAKRHLRSLRETAERLRALMSGKRG